MEKELNFEKWTMAKGDFDQKEYSKVVSWCNSNGEYTIEDVGDYFRVAKIEPYQPTNDDISQMRQLAYIQRTDSLTLRKLRKEALGEWTEEEEQGYVLAIKKITSEIKNEFPYNSEEPILRKD